jgi:Histidine kinase
MATVVGGRGRRRARAGPARRTQQRLVSLGLELRLAQSLVPTGLGELEAEVGMVADELRGVVEDLREIARGIHPAARGTTASCDLPVLASAVQPDPDPGG